MEITTVGLDLAKNVFQVHAIGSTGGVVVRRSLRRAQVIPFFSKLPPCLIGMEACGTSHHWARELVGLGHDVFAQALRRGLRMRHGFDALDVHRGHLVHERKDAVQLLLHCSSGAVRELQAGEVGEPPDLVEGKHKKVLLRP